MPSEGEGVVVWRPVEASQLPDGRFVVRDADDKAPSENWRYPPGSIVRCEEMVLSDERVLAIESLA